MSEKLKKLISYNVHKRTPQTHSRTKGKGMWFVKMYVYSRTHRTEIEMETEQPVELHEILPDIMEELTAAIGELSPIIDAGFTVYQREDICLSQKPTPTATRKLS